MTKLLHLIGSPRGVLSASTAVATTYIDALVQANPTIEVDRLDVWDLDLPHFGVEAISAKYSGIAGLPLTVDQQNAWDKLSPLVDRIISADELVISVPMWNFGIPYRLKHFIDLVTQKDYLFRFDETGFTGMATAKALVVCTRGTNYATGTDTPESEFDYQKAYMLTWLKFIGVTNVRTITLEQLLFGTEAKATSIAAGKATAIELAKI
jgi:FMN-dependent NADH-azoreductase